jgi:1-deoxy-D-xylulose 5-phosphate reductoisomerase
MRLQPTPPNVRRRLTILGSTGSIGRQALDVVRAHPSLFEVVGLSAATDVELLMRQAAEFEPQTIALESADATPPAGSDCEVLVGPGSAEQLARRRSPERYRRLRWAGRYRRRPEKWQHRRPR